MRDKGRIAPARDKQVTIQRLKSNATVTGHGEIDKTNSANWEDVATRWCQIVPKGFGEAAQDDQIIAGTTSEFTLRYDAVTAAIDPRNRLKFGTQVYNIGPIENVDQRNDTIKITGILIE